LAEHIDPSLVAHINENDLNFFLGWVQSNCKDGNFQFECLSCDYCVQELLFPLSRSLIPCSTIKI
jgi:hypothetical protein